MSSLASVNLWGRRIGAVALEEGERAAVFQYDPDFVGAGVELAPLTMPARTAPYRFPELDNDAFRGLPGLLADSLPDRFGNALIDAWLAGQGRTPESFDAVERLRYIGSRGMGALEFAPPEGPEAVSREIHIDALVELASEVMSQRSSLAASFAGDRRSEAVRDILLVGTSAGGARAKALIAWNPATDEVRSGQVDAGEGFEQWLLKFDGVSGNRDRELADPEGYGAIELAYGRMAADAGITTSPSRLLEEGGRRHFMTRRFDRPGGRAKLHVQSLGALAHLDYNLAGSASYEQALLAIRRLGLSMSAVEEQFRRAVFNVIARNQDDHVKNIAFLMDKSGAWRLSPAYDVTYAYNPSGTWTARHQMSLNGKRDEFELDDFLAVGRSTSLKRGRARTLVDEVARAVADWASFASEAGVDEETSEAIARSHRARALS